MFTFQQFKVYQENAAMKVGTDGVLLGAWTPVCEKAERILDIGTGTGLVALMLAQRTDKSVVDAVEIDAPSCLDARENFEISPWNDRLNLYNSSLQDFSKRVDFKYDLIVSNPPFFSGSLKNPNQRIAAARHNAGLSQEDLLSGVLQLLSDEGRFSLILPVSDYETFRMKAARAGLFESRRLEVMPNPGKPVKRIVSVWERVFSDESIVEEMVLELSRHHYSNSFRRIVSEFYLH
ncbi:methyltransferase [Marinilabilia sp.]|uniref:tRNA1(Val) (adenine(37)-N6)-methyltransferase n=1 Tax=Marinilabilia sp. TaxID=2021252 RepID=UPI0025BB4FD7|nr:methyltransferase [Marinilabilia sp.]